MSQNNSFTGMKIVYWTLAMLMPAIILLTKSPQFRITFLTLVYPGMVAFLSNMNALKINPQIPIIAGVLTYLLATLTINLVKTDRLTNIISEPDENKTSAIMFLSGLVIFNVGISYFISRFSKNGTAPMMATPVMVQPAVTGGMII